MSIRLNSCLFDAEVIAREALELRVQISDAAQWYSLQDRGDMRSHRDVSA